MVVPSELSQANEVANIESKSDDVELLTPGRRLDAVVSEGQMTSLELEAAEAELATLRDGVNVESLENMRRTLVDNRARAKSEYTSHLSIVESLPDKVETDGSPFKSDLLTAVNGLKKSLDSIKYAKDHLDPIDEQLDPIYAAQHRVEELRQRKDQLANEARELYEQLTGALSDVFNADQPEVGETKQDISDDAAADSQSDSVAVTGVGKVNLKPVSVSGVRSSGRGD